LQFLLNWDPLANPIKSCFFHFPIFDVKLECLLHIEKKIIDNTIIALHRKTENFFVSEEKKSFVELTTYW